jgi:hypothetical protein
LGELNRKMSEGFTQSVAIAPTLTATGLSSSALYDITSYEKAIVQCQVHKLPDKKGEGVFTCTLYQSTASTWNGAVAVTMSTNLVGTGSLTSVSDVNINVDFRQPNMSVNSAYKYLGAAVVAPTGCYVSAVVNKGYGKVQPV